MRKDYFVNGGVYHICTKSIAGFRIFNNDEEFERILELIQFYQTDNGYSLSAFLRSKLSHANNFDEALSIIRKNNKKLIQIIVYCIMPTHIHLIIKQVEEKSISNYLSDILNGYTRYFNTKHGRKGPLWESRFKSVLVKSDQQLLHLTRYLHLNPVTAKIIDHPEDWIFSSYNEYLEKDGVLSICEFRDLLEFKPIKYQKFVNDQISYQRELSLIKKLLLDS